MKLHSLEVFCEVVRQRSFSRAGTAYRISQSAASQLVASMEEELGFLLINRKKRPLEPTPEGLSYFHGCRDMLQRHDAVLEEIREQRQQLSGTVRVASIYSAGLHTLTSYIQRFLSLHADSHLRLEYHHPSKVYAAVLDGDADLGIISYPKPRRELRVISWLEEEMVLALPAGHRLASRRNVDLGDLEGETFIAFDRDLKIRREIDRMLKQHQVSVQIVSAFDNIETIKQAMEISSALSILPRPSIGREVQKGSFIERTLSSDLRRPVGIIHLRKKQLSPTAQRFVRSLVDVDVNGADNGDSAS